LKEEALDRTLWRTRFGRSYGPCTCHKTDKVVVVVVAWWTWIVF